MRRHLTLSFVFAATASAALAAATPAPTTAPAAAPAAAGPSSIVIYDQANFQGRTLTLTAATPDLKPLGFDNKVSSLSISGGGEWVLCENKNYAGRCARVQDKAYDLSAIQLWGRVSSLYPIAKPAAAPAPAP